MTHNQCIAYAYINHNYRNCMLSVDARPNDYGILLDVIVVTRFQSVERVLVRDNMDVSIYDITYGDRTKPFIERNIAGWAPYDDAYLDNLGTNTVKIMENPIRRSRRRES